jgi:ssDNA-binding replication factor A large subunit
MKAFIERIFMAKKEKKIKEVLQEADNYVQEKATEAAVEAIIQEVKEDIKKEEIVTYPKPKHFPDCTCFKCDRWKKQNNAK